jgi:hypothetical protein
VKPRWLVISKDLLPEKEARPGLRISSAPAIQGAGVPDFRGNRRGNERTLAVMVWKKRRKRQA